MQAIKAALGRKGRVEIKAGKCASARLPAASAGEAPREEGAGAKGSAGRCANPPRGAAAKRTFSSPVPRFLSERFTSYMRVLVRACKSSGLSPGLLRTAREMLRADESRYHGASPGKETSNRCSVCLQNSLPLSFFGTGTLGSLSLPDGDFHCLRAVRTTKDF